MNDSANGIYIRATKIHSHTINQMKNNKKQFNEQPKLKSKMLHFIKLVDIF